MVVYTHLEDYIRNLYFKLGISRPDQLNMQIIASMIGIDIVYRNFTLMLDDEIHIQKGDYTNEWMEFGHELCHHLRHHGCQFDMHPLYVDLQEWQATNFAYHFCVPTFMLEELNLPSTQNEAIGLIAKEFSVSFEFAEARLDKWLNKNNLLDIKTLTSNY